MPPNQQTEKIKNKKITILTKKGEITKEKLGCCYKWVQENYSGKQEILWGVSHPSSAGHFQAQQ